MPYCSHRYFPDQSRVESLISLSDLKLNNILLGIEDDRILHDLVQQEHDSPSPAKILRDRCIYPHRNFGDLKSPPSRPKIGDFGLAVQINQDLHYHPIQPDCLQAPEVILCAGWSYSADIWNLGAMVRTPSLTYS